MIFNAQSIKSKLLSIVDDMAKTPWLFAKDSKRDFTRERKLPFSDLIRLLLSMGSKSIDCELHNFTNFSPNTVSAPAFIQQRAKLSPNTMEYIFHKFYPEQQVTKKYKGYRLLAVDGSALRLPTNPNDKGNFLVSTNEDKCYNLCHLNAMFDLMNNNYVDAIIQDHCNLGEKKSLVDMVARSAITDDTIVIADRGYENYNTFAHIERKDWNYIIRVKDIFSASGILKPLSLPDSPEFDVWIHIFLTRKKTNIVKANPTLYRPLKKKCAFDFLDDDTLYFPMSFRVVRFKLTDDTYECLVTNLADNVFAADELKVIYNMRWGIETSFRTLKHNIGLIQFHSLKAEYIAQEVFAALIMYNFAAMITALVTVPQNGRRYAYKVNFANAIHICINFLRGLVHPPDVEALILKHIVPIRNGRSFPRDVRKNRAPIFNYR